MAVETVFRIQQLQKSYQSRVVLDINSLNIQKGEITSLVGPSGAGKSTLLSLLCCIEQPSSGSIHYNDCKYPSDGRLELAIRRELAMVFQKPVMFNTSIYENIAYGLKLRGRQKKQITEAVEQIAERIGLAELLGQNARKLSGGELQRVALARAIVLRPSVLFLDEATSNLDPSNVAIIEQLVRYANQAFGTTVLAATHNLHQAKRLSTCCIFLHDGKLVETGSTQQMFEAAEKELTRAFLNGDLIC